MRLQADGAQPRRTVNGRCRRACERPSFAWPHPLPPASCPQAAEDSALKADACSRRALPRAITAAIPGLAAVRACLILVLAPLSMALASSVVAAPAAVIGVVFGMHAVELALHILVSGSNPGLCEPQTVVVSHDGVATIAAGPGSQASQPGGAKDATAHSPEGVFISHSRWPLRTQSDPSGRHLRRDGTPARVVLFHRYDPFTSNCIGADNVVPFSALSAVWAANSAMILGCIALMWLQADSLGLSLALASIFVAALANSVFAVARLVGHFASLAANVTAYEAANSRRIVYLRGPSGESARPFDRGSAFLNVLESLALTGHEGVHNWRTQPLFSVAEIRGHPLIPVLVEKMRELGVKASESGLDSLSSQQRLALALAALELPEATVSPDLVEGRATEHQPGASEGRSVAQTRTPGPAATSGKADERPEGSGQATPLHGHAS